MTNEVVSAIAATMSHLQQFMSLGEVTAVLSTCRSLRNDVTLAVCILQHNQHGQHFFQKCSYDWFDVIPAFDVDSNGVWQQCGGKYHEGSGPPSSSSSSSHSSETGHPSTFLPYIERSPRRHTYRLWTEEGLNVFPSQCSQLVNLTALVDNWFLRWCYRPMTILQEVHVVRPVVIPLASLEDENVPGVLTCCSWTREQLFHRLQLHNPGMASRMFDSFSSSGLTHLAVHWDNIHVSSSGIPSCQCCDALEPCVREYRQTVALMYRRWLTRIQAGRAYWNSENGFSDMDVQDLAASLREELLPSDGFFTEEMATASDEEVMAHICCHTDMSHAFAVNGDDSSHDADGDQGSDRDQWLVTFNPTMRELCRDFFQPFKVFSASHLIHTSRGPVSWLSASTVDLTNGSRADLVTGLAPSGFLVGFFYMVRGITPPIQCAPDIM